MASVDLYAELMQPGEVPDPLGALLSRRPTWMARAACRGLPLDLFFPPPGAGGRLERARGAQGLAVCSRCPVTGPCASFAAEEALEGIYGETTTPERRAAGREVA